MKIICANCGKIKSTHKGRDKWCDVDGLKAVYPYPKKWDSKMLYWINEKIYSKAGRFIRDGLPEEDFQWKDRLYFPMEVTPFLKM